MKKHFFGISLVLLMLLFIQQSNAQTMYVKQVNNLQTSYAINNISKMVFSQGNIVVDQINGNDIQYELDSIRYIAFQIFSTSIQENNNQLDRILMYPNPVNSILNIDLKNSPNLSGTIQIYSINGSMVHSVKINPNSNHQHLDVSHLSQGAYLCKITCGLKTETIKFIKQ